MIRKLLACAIVVLCVGTVPCHAGKNVSYNPSQWQHVKIIKQGYTGSYSQVVDVSSQYTVMFEGGCVRVYRTTSQLTKTNTYEFGVLLDSTESWSVPVTEVVMEFCL